MKKIARPLWIGAVVLVLLSSSCNLSAQTAAPAGTILPDGLTSPVLATSTELPLPGINTPFTSIIPVTGENVVEMQCQFCVNDLSHAVLIFPEFAIYDLETTTSAPVLCNTAEVINGQRVLICSGMQQTTFNLKICSDPSNCLLFPVALQRCPLAAAAGSVIMTATPMTPVFLTAINTLRPPTATSNDSNPGPSQTTSPTVGAGPTPTPTSILPPVLTPSSLPLPTPTGVPVTLPPVLTDTVAPTEAATSAPEATSTPEPANDHRRDTHTPRPSRP